MPVITKITVQKRNKDRYNIFTDDGEGEKYAFSIDQDVFIKFQLKKGMELDDLAVTELLFQDDIRKAYNSAIQYLSHRMRAEGEVRERLLKKEISETIVEDVVNKLRKHNYLNDDEFAKAYVRTQVNTTDKGPGTIKVELKEKSVAEAIIEEALIEFPREIQIEKAIHLGTKFSEKNKKDSSKIVKQKLEQFLLRKGYTFEIINIALNEVATEKQEDAEMDALSLQGNKLMKKYDKLPEFERIMKIKQSLYRKGFSIGLIEKYLSQLKEEN